jgi:FtsP/CotA-like multicopper oxidase with cupredoxin domain
MNTFQPSPATDASRRRFVQGLALGGAAATFGLLRPRRAWAMKNAAEPAVLTGTDFALEIDQTAVNYTGKPRIATTVNGSLPGPVLRWREGSHVRLSVTNRLHVPTSIHWHGIVLPFDMDGVPGISFDGIAPGETFVYQFPVRQSGTYWYRWPSNRRMPTELLAIAITW